MTPVHRVRRSTAAVVVTLAFAILALAVAVLAPLVAIAPADAHGFSSVVYVDASKPADAPHGTVRAAIELEYDLLVVSVADYEDAPQFFKDGMDVFQTGDEASALNAHADEITAYVSKRFEVTAGDAVCTPERIGDLDATLRDDVPYAILTLDFACDPSSTHEFRSSLFPDDEEYVQGTVTILEYDLDGQTGSATLNTETPVFSTHEPVFERFGHFFVLGAEHLLFGIDHILFLLVLIVGSRRLRDIVLAATAFTVAHSLTFIFAALGLVAIPATIVEPLIAASIAVVAIWYLWRVWRERSDPSALLAPAKRSGLDRLDVARLGVVFGFGLLHGLGFASALGIDEPFSWPLLGSLLVFNLGIEAVQLTIILVVFPVLALLRGRTPRAGLLVGVVTAAGVALMGLIWFVQRLLDLG